MKPARLIFALVLLSTFIAGCNPSNNDGIPDARDQAPGFRLSDINGNQVALSDYKGKKAVLIMFWTTWCHFCRTALRSLEGHQEELREAKVELLTIDVGEPAGIVSGFIKKLGLDVTVLLDTENIVSDSYGLLGVPSYFLINKSGNIVFSGSSFPKGRLKELISE